MRLVRPYLNFTLYSYNTLLPGPENPAAADHRRHDANLGQTVGRARERVAVEDDEIRQPAGHERAEAPLVPG